MDSGSKSRSPRRDLARKAALWVLAVVVMFAAARYQRRTGPTYEMSGEFEWAGQVHRYELTRSEETVRDAEVVVPRPDGSVTGTLWFKRYGTADDFGGIPMRAEGDSLVGSLPAQPAAGKLEYYVVLSGGGRVARIPARADDNPILRFKGPVPRGVLLPHILAMFVSMMIGVRAGLAALFSPDEMRRLSWITLVGITAGGMILGPIVQKYAFGAYWTGFPWGYDLTDNKTLIMWLGWIVACGAFFLRAPSSRVVSRGLVVAATAVMIAVYLIPHSLRGSALDYDKLERGVPVEEAIKTG